MRLKAVFSAVLLTALAAGSAHAQSSLLQGGPFTPGRMPQYVGQGSTQPIVQDGGPAAGGGPGVNPSELGVTARGTGTAPYAGQGSGPSGANVCYYDAPTTNAAGYHYLCFSANAQGGGLLTYGYGGSTMPLPFQICVNGACYMPGVSTGSAPTFSGTCTIGSWIGGNTAGRATLSSNCTTAQSFTVTFATTSPNGWSCAGADNTAVGVGLREVGFTSTTALLAPMGGNATSGDNLTFACTGF